MEISMSLPEVNQIRSLTPSLERVYHLVNVTTDQPIGHGPWILNRADGVAWWENKQGDVIPFNAARGVVT